MTSQAAKFDPYVELGVGEKATEEEARAAFRRRAKVVHPDNKETGDRAAFDRATRALAVVMDPERRRKFDETGEDAGEEDLMQEVWGAIDQHLKPPITAYIKSGFKPRLDPRKINLGWVVKSGLRLEISDHEKNIAVGEKAMAVAKDIEERFTTDKPSRPLQAMWDANARSGHDTLRRMRRGLLVRKMALDLMEGYTFKFDSPDDGW